MYKIGYAKMDKSDVGMGPGTETKDAGKNESSPKENQPPETLELKRHGYLALARGLGSGVYEPNGLASQASVGYDFMGRQSRDHLFAGLGDNIRSTRQSSIDTEPQTLNLISVREAKDGAAEIVDKYDEEEAMHMFLKDAEDERLREEALAAILPTSEMGVSL